MTSQTDHPRTAVLKFASAEAAQGKNEVPCLFGKLERKTLTLFCNEQPVVSGPVSVEYNDTMFLGDIVRWSSAANGTWQVEILVDQVLTGLESLLRFRAQLLGEGAGPAPEHPSSCRTPIYA